MKKIAGFYFITDSELSKTGIENDVRGAIDGGASCVQYREKNKPYNEMLKEVLVLKEICRGKVPLIINDNLSLAKETDVDGIHLGQDDNDIYHARKALDDDKIIGISTHSVKEALAAEKAGANYIGFGPVFQTSTKADAGTPLGLGALREVCEAVNIPVAAIGGINPDNAESVIITGADCLCAISASIGNDTKLRVINLVRLFYPKRR